MAGMAVGTMTQFVLGAFAPLIVTDLGLSRVQFGGLPTVLFGAAWLLSPPLAAVADRWSSRAMFAVLCTTGAGAMLFMAGASGYAWLVVAACLGGAANAGVEPRDQPPRVGACRSQSPRRAHRREAGGRPVRRHGGRLHPAERGGGVGLAARPHRGRHPRCGSPGLGAWYGPDAQQRWSERAERARREGLRSLAEFQVGRWFTAGFAERDPVEANRMLEIFAADRVEDYEVACAAMGAVDLRDGIEGITCATAVAVGADDYATPVEFASYLADHIAGASLTVIDGASHLSPVERPNAVLEAVGHAL